MKTIMQRVIRWGLAGFCAILALSATAADKAFTANDLKRFLTEGVPFLEWVRTNHQDRVMARLMEQPQSIAEFPESGGS